MMFDFLFKADTIVLTTPTTHASIPKGTIFQATRPDFRLETLKDWPGWWLRVWWRIRSRPQGMYRAKLLVKEIK